MAIEKNCFKVSRLDSEFSSRSRESMSSEDDVVQRRSSVVESDDDDEFNDCDSGAGSDDFDLLELGEVGEEFCQVADQTCSIPFELYDLAGLDDVLSMDVWNECLTEEERFSLTKYLPDMDQETFMRTLKELFTGSDFHFGSPVKKLFDMLKGGLCEPRVALYRQGLNAFQKRQHYHLLLKHQNSMVSNLNQIRNAWLGFRGYSIEEKLQVLNITRSQNENMEEDESDSSEMDESREGFWRKKLKDRKHGLKMSRRSVSGVRPTLDFPSRGRPKPLDHGKFGKQNPKGTLKLAGPKASSAKELVGCFPSVYHDVEMQSGQYGSPLAALPRQNKAVGYDLGAAFRMRDHMRGDDDAEETMYEVAVQRDRNFSRVSGLDKAMPLMMGRNHEALRVDEYPSSSVMGLPGSLNNDLHAYGSNRTVNTLSDIKVLTAKPSAARISYDYGKKAKYLEKQFPAEGQPKYGTGRTQHLSLKGSWNELSDGSESYRHNTSQAEAFSVDPSFKYGDWDVKSKKLKIERDSSDFNVNANPLQEKVRAISMQNGGRDTAILRGSRRFARSEETESDSSERSDEDDDDNPLMRSKMAYPRASLDGSFMHSLELNAKLLKKDKKDNAVPLNGLSHYSRKMADFSEPVPAPDLQDHSLKSKQKGKFSSSGRLQNSAAKLLEDSYFSESGMLNGDDEQKPIHKMGRNGQLRGEHSGRLHTPSLKAHTTERRQKGEFGRDYPVHQSNDLKDDEDDSPETRPLPEDNGVIGRSGKKSKVKEAYADERSDVSLSLAKKKKLKGDVTCDERDDKEYVHSFSQQQLDDITSSKKRGKRKLDDDLGNFEMGTSEPTAAEMGTADLEPEIRLQKKPFILITPTVHSGFTFSIIHLLSAVRVAMITLLPEDSLEAGKHLDKNDGRQDLMDEQVRKTEGTAGVHLHENLDGDKSGDSVQLSVPFLPVQEIVNRVRSNPGDPCILETQEPLLDLIRGVLKIFSSKTAPLGAKGWKPLAFYEKSSKNWSWVGPVPHNSSDHEAIEEVTSSEAWGIPHKMLVKLVDAFANWLKSSQETLQQIGSLPAPPLMQFNLDEKDRFRDLRAQKSLITINPSSEEVRDYFRKEENLRYSIPDRAFSYTAVDGRKSIVAPLRRCGGKPTSKAREHFILKRDRPPHVTILCLVRDAASRLPGSIGTRADVCTLIRDSQYIVEDVSDAQVNSIVSGALDRLHYERDPCVRFDGERKLWVYLHREREEEDFEDDGTSSTKKWKRPKKEATEPFEQATVTVAYHGAEEQTGFDLSNIESLCMDEDKRVELMYYDDGHNLEENVEATHGAGPEEEALHQRHPMGWEPLGFSNMQENKLLCQENSTNDDFDDETFGGDPPTELLSSSLS